MLLLFIPIMITVNLAEKIGKILEKEVPFWEVMEYYLNFTIVFANLLFPIFLFLSVIWFTSKLANNTEVIAFLSSGVSFTRFLRPYLIGASIVAAIALLLGLYLAPKANTGFNEFKYKYLKGRAGVQDTKHVYSQINDNDIIYVSSFNPSDKSGRNFTLEHFEGNELKYKIFADQIKYDEKDSTYKLTRYVKRVVGQEDDSIFIQRRMNFDFKFNIEEFTPVSYAAETKTYSDLVRFIEREKKKGSSQIGRYEVVKYRKWSLPVSVFILTIIGLSVSSVKRRGGMGVNLLFGISIALVYVFFDKIFGVMAEQSSFSPLVAVWFPNIIFGILAIYILYNAKR
ncbi:LptF/LptG family permease [Microcosmobacter mediterraneus]